MRLDQIITSASAAPVDTLTMQANTDTLNPAATDLKYRLNCDRRRYPRVATRLPAQLISDGNPVLAATVINLSRLGLLVAFDQGIAYRLLPGGHIPSRATPTLSITFELEDSTGNRIEIDTRCRIIELRRFSQDEFHLGVQFIGFGDRGFELLNQFVIDSSQAHRTHTTEKFRPAAETG